MAPVIMDTITHTREITVMWMLLMIAELFMIIAAVVMGDMLTLVIITMAALMTAAMIAMDL